MHPIHKLILIMIDTLGEDEQKDYEEVSWEMWFFFFEYFYVWKAFSVQYQASNWQMAFSFHNLILDLIFVKSLNHSEGHYML